MARKIWVQSQVASYQTLKMVLDTSLLSIQQYKGRIKGKVEQSRESSRTPYTWCSSYCKGSLLVALDNGRPRQRSPLLLFSSLARSRCSSPFSLSLSLHSVVNRDCKVHYLAGRLFCVLVDFL